MTHKDFEAIAYTIKHANLSDLDREHMAHEFVRTLIGTNPRFDRDRFTKACGI